jgi:hypothetical protein
VSRFGVLGFRVSDSGCRAWGLWFRVWGLGFRESRVEGLGAQI